MAVADSMNTLIDALLESKIITPEHAAKVEADKRAALSKKYNLEKDLTPKVK